MEDLQIRESDDGWSDGEWSDGESLVIRTPSKSSTLSPIEHLKANAKEAQMHAPLFTINTSFNDFGASLLCLGIELNNLPSMTMEQLAVWNILSQDKFLVIRLRVSAHYLRDSVPPQIEIGLSSNLDPRAELRPFCLGWTIQDRLKNELLATENWPPHIDEKMSASVQTLAKLVEMTWQDYAQCILALRECDYDSEKATALLRNRPEMEGVEARCAPKIGKSGTIELPRPVEEKETVKEEVNDTPMQPATVPVEEQVMDEKADEESHLLNDYNEHARNNDLQVNSLVEMFGADPRTAAFAISRYGYERAVDAMLAGQMDQLKRELARHLIAQRQAQTRQPQPALKAVKPAPSMAVAGGSGGRRTSMPLASGQPRVKPPYRRPRGPTAHNAMAGFGTSYSTDDEDEDEESEDADSIESSSEDDLEILHAGSKQIMFQVGTDPKRGRKLALLCQHNFLVRLMCFVWQTILDGNKRCMICHKCLPFVALKPTICNKALCSFQQCQIGLGFSLAREIATNSDIVDLLINIFIAGCRAKRIAVACPKVVRSTETGEATPLNENDPNLPDMLLKYLLNLEKMSTMKGFAEQGEKALKRHLNSINPMAYGLLCWIVSSNRCHLRKLDATACIPELNPQIHQFALCSATPEREAKFQRYKEQYGSFFAFHGSPIGNWHAIFRVGLKNYSGSKYQMHGNVYGNGIYLADRLNVSLAYSLQSKQKGWSCSEYSDKLLCLSICEVIQHPNIAPQKYNPQSGGGVIYVVQNEKFVITRFFIVCDKNVDVNQMIAQVMTASDLTIPEVVHKSAETL